MVSRTLDVHVEGTVAGPLANGPRVSVRHVLAPAEAAPRCSKSVIDHIVDAATPVAGRSDHPVRFADGSGFARRFPWGRQVHRCGRSQVREVRTGLSLAC